jgi:hypothetical protein
MTTTPPPPADPLAGLRPPTEPNPFAGIVDEPELSHDELRTRMLQRVKRTHVPLRKVFVQQPMTSTTRPSVLGDMVNAKKLLPLRALLLIHALEPMLSDTYWTLDVWARLIGGAKGPQSKERVAVAMRYLKSRKLIDLTHSGQTILVAPRHEDGEGGDFVRASADGADVGHGYLTIPTQFWTSGLADELTMPGIAMFLVCLSETTKAPSFQVAMDQMQRWYGLSERTAERGYRELNKAKVLLEHTQRVNALNSPTTRTKRVHRALSGPYSTAARESAQAAVRDLLRPAAAPEATSTPTSVPPTAP